MTVAAQERKVQFAFGGVRGEVHHITTNGQGHVDIRSMMSEVLHVEMSWREDIGLEACSFEYTLLTSDPRIVRITTSRDIVKNASIVILGYP